MNENNESIYFDASAASYDWLEPLRIEGHTVCHQLALDFLPVRESVPFRVLDLGCGTGMFVASVLRTRPDAMCVGLDYSEAMLGRAAQAVVPYTERTEFRRWDMNDGLPNDIGTFDLIVAFWSVHHVKNAKKSRLFDHVYGALRPDGWFFLVDSMSGAFDKALYDAGVRRNKARLESSLSGVDKHAHESHRLSAIKTQVSEDSPEKDRFASAEIHHEWLAGAGFGSIDRVWQLWNDHFLICRP
jgi:SAM-dependent methyltransferase